MKGTLVLHEHQYWRLLTSSLLHAGLVHIGLNSLALWFCRRLELLIGTLWFLTVFAASAVGGSLASLCINSLTTTSVGASGGIMGLLAAQAVAAYYLEPGSQLRQSMQQDATGILAPMMVPVLFMGSSGGVQEGVDVAAHLGGAIVGAVLGLVRLAEWRAQGDQG